MIARSITLSEKDKLRFNSKIIKSESCWVWTGAKDRKGYGKLSIGPAKNPDGSRRNSMVSAHRISYEMFVAEIPEGKGFHGMCVLHKCDNPSCVNPAHLFIGTNKDNVADMDAKGRRITAPQRGSSHVNSLLTEEQVTYIYRMTTTGQINQRKLASMFGVSLSTISCIKTGLLWSHLTGAKK